MPPATPESYAPASANDEPLIPLAPATTYIGALEQLIGNPVGTTEQAYSQLQGDLSSTTPVSDVAQNVAGSLSQSQVNDLISQCTEGVAAAGGTDSGQCADLINATVAQANASPITASGVLGSIPTWLWIALGGLGFILIFDLVR
jgi:hypothetical protein